MSYLDRIRECNRRDMRHFRPFIVAATRVGWVKPPFLDALRDFPRVFRVTEDAVLLDSGLADADSRTAAVDGVLRHLAEAGVIAGWRDEVYPVATGWGVAPLLRMERAAVPHFGVRAFGVHMNGFVRDGSGLSMWIGRRAYDKPTFPGMLDNMVAGGQPYGLGLDENLIKECAEEADIPETLARRGVPVGAISYRLETPEGLKPDVQFVYDLELPPSFTPRNTDGEIESFALHPIETVAAIVRETREFKFNCNLVIIDFLVRHGLIAPGDPDYLDIVQGLHQ